MRKKGWIVFYREKQPKIKGNAFCKRVQLDNGVRFCQKLTNNSKKLEKGVVVDQN